MDAPIFGPLIGGIDEIQSNMVQAGSFACASNFSNITLDSNLEHSGAQLQLKSLVSDTISNQQVGMFGTGAFIAGKHVAPGGLNQVGAYSYLDYVLIQVRPTANENIYGKLTIWNDVNGSPGNILYQDAVASLIYYGAMRELGAYVKLTLTGGQYLWIGVVKTSGSAVFYLGASTSQPIEWGELVGDMKASSNGSSWSGFSGSYVGIYMTTKYRPVTGSYSRDILAANVLKWKQLSGQNPTLGAGQTHTLNIKDTSGNTLIAGATDPQDLSSIAKTYTKLSLEGTLARGSADITSPTIDPFTVTYVSNILAPVQWNNKVYATSAPTGAHQANTHINLTGSGFLIGIIDPGGSTWAVQVDGGLIHNLNSGGGGLVSLFPIRFNTSLKVTCSVASNVSYNAWYILD